uniref:NADH dehydrogenase subunit 5 n=1 Tax=Ophrygonius sp. TaxID=2897803 RepID=UPI001EDD094B|nr:NADH dehydrogenase subunit 5 [Ophrygonius sp.]UIN24738.1 NADH dehydrogenase subunit 5 [Ophrygonius sp.]
MVIVCYIYSFWLFIFSVVSLFYSLEFINCNIIYFIEYELFSLNSSMFMVSILLDWMSLLFLSFVMFISSMVIFYCNEYMVGDLFLNRFIYLVVLFIFSMFFLIISPNLISILLGWDGLGLVSYCLVVYYNNYKSYNAGMITVLSNRVGDVALILGISWMVNYGDWNFYLYLNFNLFFIIGMLMFIAAITKSAQIPFSAWLPEAMAAPTPVSSLVHSSTLVTAGVFLLIRFYYVLSNSILSMLMILSLLTMLLSGISANFEYDLKKIIALSTLSQLGMMMFILSLGSVDLAFFHLLIHAVFKALLFMCAGLLIHLNNGIQDIRVIGGSLIHLPLLKSYILLSILSLCGMPFFSGFYSKDLIAEILSVSEVSISIYMMFYFTIGLTVSYSIRLMYYVLWSEVKSYKYCEMSSSFMSMMKGMSGLIFWVILLGSVLSWIYIIDFYFIYLSFIMKTMTLLFVVLGGVCSMMMVFFKSYYNYLNLKFFGMLGNFLFFSLIFNKSSVSYSKMIIYMEQGWLEKLGSQGLYLSFSYMSNKFYMLFKENFKILLMMIYIFIVFMYLI